MTTVHGSFDLLHAANKRKVEIENSINSMSTLHTELINEPTDEHYISLKANYSTLHRFSAITFDALIDEVTCELNDVICDYEVISNKYSRNAYETYMEILRTITTVRSLKYKLPKKFMPDNNCVVQ